MPETSDDLTMFETRGYAAVDANMECLELQRCDELGKYPNDNTAAEACKRDALAGDAYAYNELVSLAENYVQRNGIGRHNQPHDMDAFNLWGFDTAAPPR